MNSRKALRALPKYENKSNYETICITNAKETLLTQETKPFQETQEVTL